MWTRLVVCGKDFCLWHSSLFLSLSLTFHTVDRRGLACQTELSLQALLYKILHK